MKSNILLLSALLTALTLSSCNLFQDANDDDHDEPILVSYENGQFLVNDCSELGGLSSPTNTLATNIRFENETGEVIKIYWVNFTGELTPYNNGLSSGSAFLQQTFLEHPWYITTNDETCIKIVTALRPGVTDTVRFSK